VINQEFDQTSIVRENVNRPRFDFGKDALMEVLDLEGHGRRLAKTRTSCNGGTFMTPNKAVEKLYSLVHSAVNQMEYQGSKGD
jgi:hypothetical protein